MTQIAKPIVVLLLLFGSVLGQEAETEKSKSGMAWLKQFEGQWQLESKTPGNEGKTSGTAVMTGRLVGSNWVVLEQNGKMGPMNYGAVQTMTFDPKEKKYAGTWIDTTSTYEWRLTGELIEDGKKLEISCKGPAWNDPSKTSDYRDIYEFKSANEIASVSQMRGDDGKWQTFSQSKMTRVTAESESLQLPEKSSVTPFLMFTGQAEEAIEYYKTIFDDLKVVSVKKYKEGEAGKAGTIQLATFEVAGTKVMCTDSPPVHDFTFTPSFSFFVECESVDELKAKFKKLSDGGTVMMPVNNYGFSDQFGWTSDKYGVSWQLNYKSD